MKRSICFSVALATALTLGAAAQTPSAPLPSAPARAGAGGAVPSSVGPAKIAVIAFQVAVTSTNQFQRSFVDLQKKYQPKRDALKTLNESIDSLTKELQATDSKLTDQEKATKARQLDEKKKQFDREQGDDQNDFQQEMQDLFQETGSKLFDELASYAQQHGYTLVLDVASQQNPVMYVAAPTTDITKEVVAAYNMKSGVAPLPAGAAPAVGAPVPKVAPKPPAK